VRRLELALLLLVAALAVAVLVLRRGSAPPPSPYCRGGPPLAGVYHPARLHVRRRCAVATGVVTKVKFEDFDGDVHIDLQVDDRRLLSEGNRKVGGALVVEIVPQDRGVVAIPETGARVTVVGPWVDDTAHGWREIHPAWWISTGRLLPASPRELGRVESLLRDTSSN
jgi:hypothetical protein